MEKTRKNLLKIQKVVLSSSTKNWHWLSITKVLYCLNCLQRKNHFLDRSAKYIGSKKEIRIHLFFHKIVKGRELQKRITTLYGSDGHVIKDEQLIKMEIINF